MSPSDTANLAPAQAGTVDLRCRRSIPRILIPKKNSATPSPPTKNPRGRWRAWGQRRGERRKTHVEDVRVVVKDGSRVDIGVELRLGLSVESLVEVLRVATGVRGCRKRVVALDRSGGMHICFACFSEEARDRLQVSRLHQENVRAGIPLSLPPLEDLPQVSMTHQRNTGRSRIRVELSWVPIAFRFDHVAQNVGSIHLSFS